MKRNILNTNGPLVLLAEQGYPTLPVLPCALAGASSLAPQQPRELGLLDCSFHMFPQKVPWGLSDWYTLGACLMLMAG